MMLLSAEGLYDTDLLVQNYQFAKV